MLSLAAEGAAGEPPAAGSDYIKEDDNGLSRGAAPTKIESLHAPTLEPDMRAARGVSVSADGAVGAADSAVSDNASIENEPFNAGTDDGSMLANVLEQLASIENEPIINAGNGGEADDDLRIETFTRTNADGTDTTYWQWAARKRKPGKHGGKKWRSYGGIVTGGKFTESSGKRGGARRKKQNFT